MTQSLCKALLIRLGLATGLMAMLTQFAPSQERDRSTHQDTGDLFDISKWSPAESKAQIQKLAAELNQNGKPPVDYVISKFKKFDVVLFGEVHEVKENCEFVSSLIAPMYDAGVRILFSEFIPTRFNTEIEKITNADRYDREAVIEIFRQRPSPVWGFAEYMEIVEAVWRLNRKLKDGQPKFKLMGLEDDWNEVDFFGFNQVERFKAVVKREQHMTKLIRELSLDQKQKSLVHIGFSHTIQHGIRVAIELEKSHPGRNFQVVAHMKLSGTPKQGAISKCLEQAVKQSRFDSVGFDVEDSAFAKLRDESSYALKLMGKNATLKDLVRGYVLLKPLSDLKSVTWVDGFVTDETFEEALDISRRKRWIKKKPRKPAELDRWIAEHFRSRNQEPKK